MSMSEVMSMSDLSLWPQLAMVLFAGVFLLVMRRLWATPKTEIGHAASLPLEDATTTARGGNLS